MAIIYGACVLGAIGVLLALPRRGVKLGLLGGILGGAALGAAFLALLPRLAANGDAAVTGAGPGVLFYIFAFIAAAGALRMITHPRPVYAAMYFILVVIASGGLFLLLAAEFMAFALVIVYAGAILITYLFVIMLAQETPDDDDHSVLTEYDANAREPVAAVMAGFVLMAMLLGVAYQGTAEWRSQQVAGDTAMVEGNSVAHASSSDLELLLGKVERELQDRELLTDDAHVTRVDTVAGIVTYSLADSADEETIALPEDISVSNIETIGLSLFMEFPVSLELAGVILFMAMLGAVVLSRRPQVLNVLTPDTASES